MLSGIIITDLKTLGYISIGVIYTLALGHFAIKYTIDQLWVIAAQHRPDNWRILTSLQGIVERALYMSAWILDKPEFIGFWIALKVASNWKKWSEKLGFDVFLIGTALTVGYSFVGVKLIDYLTKSKCDEALLLSGVLVIANMLIVLRAIIWIRNHSDIQIQPLETDSESNQEILG